MNQLIKKVKIRAYKFKRRSYKSFIESIKRLDHLATIIEGTIKGSLVNAYWGGGPSNLGDFLPPILLEYYGLKPIKTPKKNIDTTEILTIGSILDLVSQDYSGYVVGSGLMYDADRHFPSAKILAVRGALTRDRVGAPKDTPLGDPGLLVPKIYKKRKLKIYTLGLVPHYVDKHDERIREIFDRYPDKIKIIDIQQKPENAISDIDQCEFILSSSLHGLITADSLGIPGGWILLSDKVAGEGFKFRDYSSAFGMSIEPKSLTGKESIAELIGFTRMVDERVYEVQRSLDIVFKNLSNEIRNNRKQRNL